jgi:epoxyqueuosine reductase
MSTSNPSLETALKAEAKRLGFVSCGIAAASQSFAPQLTNWLEAGRHGTMGWMEARQEQRSGPQALWSEAKSVIALGMSYAPGRDPLSIHQAKARGAISVYAQGADYHDVVKKALKALARWLIDAAGGDLKVFVDTAPIMEKPLSASAGLGWQGKHSNLVSPEHGSWLFLGAIMTNLDLVTDPPQRDQCGSCSACQTACPTDAFPAPYQLDARRCISYLTIEHKGPIPLQFRRAMGNRIYGCDDCLAVCPWNKFAKHAAANRAFAGRAELAAPALADLLALDDVGFRQVFAGSPIKRIGRDRMVRNAAIAAGNSSAASLVQPLKELLNDPSEVVREAAEWALYELSIQLGQTQLNCAFDAPSPRLR